MADAEHRPDGIRGDELRVVIEEEQVIAFRLLRAEIVDRGIVEGALIPDHSHPFIPSGKLLVGSKCLRLFAVVLDDHVFQILPAALLLNRRDAPQEVLLMILIGDHDGNEGFAVNRLPDAVDSFLRPSRDLGIDSHAL